MIVLQVYVYARCLPSHQDNNDGITVVDITDLENPAYCFFGSRGSDKPLDAREYLSRYEPVAELESVDATSLSTPDESAGRIGNKRKKYLLRTIRSLQDVPLLDAGMVEEAWPTTRKSANSHVAATAEPPSIPSLVDSTLEKAVAQALTTDGGQTDLEMLLCHPGKATDIMNVLRTMNPIPPKAVELLSRIVQGVGGTTSPRVDISKFQLTRDQIIHILLSIHATQETLDLSNNTVLVASDVPTIVAAAGPALRRIVLMGCSSIENASLLSLVQECPPELKSLESILHPAFFTITKTYPYPSAFTFVHVRKNGSLACASIPMFTPAHVIQAVTDAIPWRVASETKWGSPGMPPMFVDHALPLAGCSALQGGLRKSEMGFDQRTVVTVPHLTPKVPREEKNLWTFVLRVSTWMGEHEGWAFVRLIPRGAPAASSSDCVDEAKGRGPLVLLHEAYSGQIYDLRGFLKYMEDEGRPMPAEDAVEKLQTLLDARDEKTGEARCPFLSDLTVAGIEGRYDPIQKARYSEWGFAL